MISIVFLFAIFVVGLAVLIADLVQQHRLERQEARAEAEHEQRPRERRIVYPERRKP